MTCLIGLAALAALPCTAAVPPPARGERVLSVDFEGAEPLQGWTSGGRLESGYRSAHALRIDCPAGTPARGAGVRHPVPIERLRGCLISVSAMVRAENVSERPQPWNGIKVMLPIEHPGGTLWPQGKVGTGTFDWRRVGCVVRVPPDAVSAWLYLGLEEVTGSVWFDDVLITVVRPPAIDDSAARRAPGPLRRGHPLPRLRGAMVAPDITPDSLRTFGREWNANLVRWQLVRSVQSGQESGPEAYDRWLEGALAKLDAALPLCRQYGLYVVVDLHSPPGGSATAGGYMAADADLFSDRACQDRFVEVWQRIARRYRGDRTIWGFDLANEPIEDTLVEGADDWPTLAVRAGRAIRAIDPQRTLIVECPVGGNPEGFSTLAPLDLPNVVYSVHMYLPHTFTHQTVFGPGPPVRYPGVIDGRMWDRAQLETALKPVVEFQKRWNVPIYVGEFSAIRWAPDESAYRYLKDLIDLFEEHGWDWSYHAFREWDGWSVEHGPDRDDHARASAPTTRETLLRGWFAKNRKPAWAGKGVPPR